MAFLSTLTRIWRAPWIPARYGKAPYFWMLSFVMLGWRYIYVAPSVTELLLLGLTFLCFLPVYLYSFWVHDWRAALSIAFILSLGIAWAPFNFGSSSFVIFAATMCSRFHRKSHAYLALAAVFAAVALASLMLRLETYFWIPALIFSIPSAVGAIIGERLQRANQKLFRKQEEIEHLAALAERERIARDLHDLLGHTLSVITLKAELAKKLFDRDHVACRQEIADIETTARQALAEVRSAVLGYRSTGLAHELKSALNTLASKQVQVDTEISATPLPAALENIVALALREAVTNIIRHSQAQQAHIRLHCDEHAIRFHISDDGDHQQTPPTQKPSILRGNGLNGMQERVTALGGTLSLSVQRGVAIDIVLPLPSAKDGHE